MKVAIVGDSFIDRYVIGNVNRISPEAPIPILDFERSEKRGGGAINVANNLYSLGISPVLYTITDMKLPYKVVSPDNCSPLIKTRYIGNGYQLLRVDNPVKYKKEDLKRLEYPGKNYDLIAFVDYDKGIIKGGKADIVDTKKRDLSVFSGSDILKINQFEYEKIINNNFKRYFITKSKDGIDYYENNKLKSTSLTSVKSVVDITGAGDTVMAIIIYCLAKGITDVDEIMKLANKGAGIVVGKFGTSVITHNELFS